MADIKNRCPICEEGVLAAHNGFEEQEYRGQTGNIPFVYSECFACGSEQASTAQARANKRAMLAFKKEVDGLLTGQEIKALRKRYDLTQAQAASIFGGGPVAFSKYESDDVMQSEPMDNLLRVASQIPYAVAWLAQRAGEQTVATNLLRESFSVLRAQISKQYVSEHSSDGFNLKRSNPSVMRYEQAPAANDIEYTEAVFG
ncbi:MAG: type II toxin-antitoxin system MqsA family antitoxin [Gammaproteobacteria bacterium]|nr:type II toxin-antitoxin system MqsA family antitoxin [Gammaproteobacteria bacterium]